jgi:hypothetical protein
MAFEAAWARQTRSEDERAVSRAAEVERRQAAAEKERKSPSNIVYQTRARYANACDLARRMAAVVGVWLDANGGRDVPWGERMAVFCGKPPRQSFLQAYAKDPIEVLCKYFEATPDDVEVLARYVVFAQFRLAAIEARDVDVGSLVFMRIRKPIERQVEGNGVPFSRRLARAKSFLLCANVMHVDWQYDAMASIANVGRVNGTEEEEENVEEMKSSTPRVTDSVAMDIADEIKVDDGDGDVVMTGGVPSAGDIDVAVDVPFTGADVVAMFCEDPHSLVLPITAFALDDVLVETALDARHTDADIFNAYPTSTGYQRLAQLWACLARDWKSMQTKAHVLSEDARQWAALDADTQYAVVLVQNNLRVPSTPQFPRYAHSSITRVLAILEADQGDLRKSLDMFDPRPEGAFETHTLCAARAKLEAHVASNLLSMHEHYKALLRVQNVTFVC